MKCPACDGFGGWIDGDGPNAEPMMCEVCAGSGELPDQSQAYGNDCPTGKCEM